MESLSISISTATETVGGGAVNPGGKFI